MRTDEELKQIAIDIKAYRIYADPNDLDVFIPLMLMDEKQKQDFIKEKPAMIFEYMDQAGPIAVNGKPRFFSFQFLNIKELEKVREHLNAINSI